MYKSKYGIYKSMLYKNCISILLQDMVNGKSEIIMTFTYICTEYRKGKIDPVLNYLLN
jgi:hypothetical protein